MSKVDEFINNIKQFVSTEYPQIMLGLGLSGMVTGTVLIAQAAPKANDILEAKKDELNVEKLPVKEFVGATWKLYLPGTIATVTGAGLIIGSNVANKKNFSALATAYQLTDTAFRTYQEAVQEEVTPKKAVDIENRAAENTIARHDMAHPDNKIYQSTNGGSVLCYDMYIGRYFYADKTIIQTAINDFNDKLMKDGEKPLNDLYYLLGLEEVTVGNIVGWDANHGIIEIAYTSTLTPDGVPALAFDFYRNMPRVM